MHFQAPSTYFRTPQDWLHRELKRGGVIDPGVLSEMRFVSGELIFAGFDQVRIGVFKQESPEQSPGKF
jgi:hypothetical protein